MRKKVRSTLSTSILKYFLLIFTGSLLTTHIKGQTTLPYFNDFENGPQGWYAYSVQGSSWELGTPNYGATSGTHSGNNAWDVDLDSSYRNNTYCFLQTPAFDFTGVTDAYLSVYINNNSEPRFDGTKIEYTTDTLSNWLPLGFSFTPQTINWYDSDIVGTPHFWWNETNCWKMAAIPLDPVYGEPVVYFRFKFGADGSVVGDGTSIDDFYIGPKQQGDLSVATIFTPHKDSVYTVNPAPELLLANLSNDTVTLASVGVSIDGNFTGSFPFSFTMSPMQADTITLPGFTPPAQPYRICLFTTNLTDPNTANDTLCCTVQPLSSYLPEHTDAGLSISPNPFGDHTLVEWPEIAGETNIHLTDIKGRIIFETHTNNNQIRISRSDLKAGLYFLSVGTETLLYTGKLIITD